MDNILTSLGSMIGRIIGRNSDCGLDCDISELGWPEYLLLIVIFTVFIFITKKIIRYFKHNGNKST
jgi:hypothetical protein